MPKSIVVDPKKVRKPGEIDLRSIPLNSYKPDPQKELKKFGKKRLRKIYADMVLIREFESMLNSIKTEGSYQGIEYTHNGPAHLSIGQESTSVGQCAVLEIDDYIFGSHRSHGEILAKCLAAIEHAKDAELTEIMSGYMGGKPLAVVEKDTHDSTADLAIDYVLYTVLSEIFARENGVNKGLGGSMHAFFAPFGSMPNNAIVGGSGTISVGSALYKRVNRKPGIVIANIGDASSACGPVWEAIMLSAMDQYRTLWPKELGGSPPIVFNFFNNFYGMGGQPEGETMGFGVLARLGAGVNEEAMHAERVDGYNPLAVADATERTKKLLLAGKGPALLDVITYRLSGHSPSDAMAYRTKEELAGWEEQDCVESYGTYILENGWVGTEELEQIQVSAVARVTRALEKAASLEISPRLRTDVESIGSPDTIGDFMFSGRKVEKYDDREPEVLIPMDENPRVKSNRNKSRAGVDGEGNPLPKAKVIAMRDALFEAMIHRYYIDPTLIAFGEENRDWGGAFAVYRGLTEALPYHRLFNSPISEAAIVGAGVGYALSGGRAVVELMYCDFMGRAGDEIFNQMSKWQAMSAGALEMPLVLRVSVGSKYGAQHSQDWTSIVAHIPGLKAYFPATPYDAKGMLNLALSGSDPVVFFESQRLYDIGEMFVPEGVPEGYYEIDEGEPVIRRTGTDLTMVTVGATLYRAIEAADTLMERYGVSVELIDARFINPLNYDLIVESVQKTGKLVLASDACERGSFLHSMASTVTQLAFDALDGPPVVVGSRNWITPAAEMEHTFFPQPEWIIDAIHERLLPLPDHKIQTNQTVNEIVRRHRRGV